MSLSKQIIYGSLENVNQAIQQGAPLNEIDEYGYTPLIQAAIVNDINKGRLLLEFGADVQFTDLTGRSALHWTVDNNNLDFSELLLQKKADPNAYTRAGQPILVMPLLRQQDKMKQLLYRYGGNLEFAQDFINAKLIGHRFELEGRIDVVDTHNTFIEVEFEGFYLEFNLAIVANSLIEFCQNFGGKKLRPYFKNFQSIIENLQGASELIRYQHYLIQVEQYDKAINTLLNRSPLLIPIAFEGHAISLIYYKNLLIRCDRGEYGRDHGTVIFYKMEDSKLLDKFLIKSLLYERQTQYFIDEGLSKRLKLHPIIQLPLPVQISGNCSWANVEAVVPALIFLFFLTDLDLIGRGDENRVVTIENLKKKALAIYEEWIKWDKNRALHFCIESFYKAKSPARGAAIAATLAAILFQRCNYNDPNDREKAEKILLILRQPEYRYILKSYITVFSEDKKNERFLNLVSFLDDMGLKLEQFKG